MSEIQTPAALREHVARTLRPVRRLASPRRRALVLVPIAGALVACAFVAFGLRRDAASIGLVPLMAGSALQAAVAVALLAVALGESVPGRLASRGRLAVWALLGVACVGALTYVTFGASPTGFPSSRALRYFRICLSRSLLLGALPFVLVCLQLRRGLVSRPAVTGALAGLATGLAADAAIRTYCAVSAPAHVLAAHGGAIVLLAAVGSLVGLGVLRHRSHRTNP